MSARTRNPVSSQVSRCAALSGRLGLSRRSFLRLAALGTAAGAAACAPAPLPMPTLTPPPTPIPTAPPPSATPVPTPTEAALDPELTGQMDELLQKRIIATNKVPGVAMAVVRDGRLVYSQGRGVTEVGTETVVTPETVFSWGWIAMPLTATALMQLWAEGKIDLDAPVTDYLSYFKMADEHYAAITPRQLLTHTSGLADYKGQDSDWSSGDPGAGALEQQVRSLAEDKLAYPNGGFFHLSLIGFEILGDLIAKVSGQPFETYMRERIFAPLGLKHTTCQLNEVDQAWQSKWHERAGSGALSAMPMYYSRQHAPATCLYSSVEDMARLALMYLNHGSLDEAQILTTDACEEMWTERTFSPFSSAGVKWDVCEGWLCGDNPQGRQLVLFDGPWYSLLALAPEGGVGLAMAMNFSAMSFWPNIAPIMEGLLDEG